MKIGTKVLYKNRALATVVDVAKSTNNVMIEMETAKNQWGTPARHWVNRSVLTIVRY